MFTTGSKLLVGGAVLATVAAVVYGVTQEGSLGTVGLISAARRAGVPRRRQPVHPRRRRVGDGPRRAHRVGGRRAGARRRACGRSSPPLGGRARRRRARHLPGRVHLRHHRPARRRRRVDGAGVERAGVGRRRVQRRRPRPHRPPAGVPDPRRRRRRHHHLLVQPDHAVPVEDERPGRVRRRSPRCILVVGFIVAFGPTLRTGAVAAVARRRRARAGDRRRRRGPRRRARAAPPRDHRRRSPPTASATRRARPRPTSTPRRPSPPRPTSPPRSTLPDDGTLVAQQPRRRPATRTASSSPGPTRRTCCFLNESGEERRLVLDLGTRPSSTTDGNEIPDTEVPNQRCTAARRGGRQPAADVLDPDGQRRRRRRRTAFVVPGVDERRASRWRCRDRRDRTTAVVVPSAPGTSAVAPSPPVAAVADRRRRRAALAGCAEDAPQDTWQPAGENAQKIQNLQWPVFLIAGIVGAASCSPPSAGRSSATATAASRSPSRPTASRRWRSA